MQVKILGCSGGIGDGLRTSAILVDRDILIDAGTGVGDLSIDQLLLIDHIFVTHSHLDHIVSIPFLMDTVMGLRTHPVTVHATAETINALKTHIFNWKVWPDFNVIPNAEAPFLQYREIKVGQITQFGQRAITAVPANHVVPAVGYHLDSGHHSLVFTGDTTTCDKLWQHVNSIENLKYLIIETAFCNNDIELAMISKHLCPSLLFDELNKLTRSAEIYITHLKPGEGEMIMREIEQSEHVHKPKALQRQHEFQL